MFHWIVCDSRFKIVNIPKYVGKQWFPNGNERISQYLRGFDLSEEITRFTSPSTWNPTPWLEATQFRTAATTCSPLTLGRASASEMWPRSFDVSERGSFDNTFTGWPWWFETIFCWLQRPALGQSQGSVESFLGSSTGWCADTTATLLPGKKEITRGTTEKINTKPWGST